MMKQDFKVNTETTEIKEKAFFGAVFQYCISLLKKNGFAGYEVSSNIEKTCIAESTTHSFQCQINSRREEAEISRIKVKHVLDREGVERVQPGSRRDDSRAWKSEECRDGEPFEG